MNPSSKRIRIGDSLDKIKRDEARGQPRLNLLSPPCSAPIYCRVWFCSGCLALISANRGRGETFRDSRTIDPAVRQTTTEWGWDRDRCEWEKASQQTWHDGGVTRVHKMKASPLARCSQPSPEGGAVLMRRRYFLAGSWAQETSWSWLIGNTNGAAGVERSQGSMSISWQLIGATRWPLGEANWTTASSTQWAGSAAETHQSFFFFCKDFIFIVSLWNIQNFCWSKTSAAANWSGCPQRPFESLAGTASIHSLHEYWDGTVVPVWAEIEMTEADFCCSTEEIDNINTV